MSKRKLVSNSEGASNSKKVAKKAPKTLKDKILDLLTKQESLVGLPTIKSILAKEYEVEESSANNTKINKTLKLLLEEERDDFGKIGGSYHGGKSSPAYLAHQALLDQQQAERDAEALQEPRDDMRCPYCQCWGRHKDYLVLEEEKEGCLQGSKVTLYRCLNCDKDFKVTINENMSGLFYSYGPGFQKQVDSDGCYH
eukprot:gene3828-4178_t